MKRGARHSAVAAPTSAQVRVATAIVTWYLARYYGTPADPGVAAMFCDPSRVGAFAVPPVALRRGDGAALFAILFMTAMFQRRQDVQILRILRGIEAADARELADGRRLLTLVDGSTCAHLRSTAALHEHCDLTKDPRTRVGCCTANPGVTCHLKRHTVLLKRYGHFGKVPTSLALVLREAGAPDLGALRTAVFRRVRDPAVRARALEAALSRAWRVSQKIASMFLSAVSNPDLGAAPWSKGVDWTYFVVVDSNVDLFLASVGYRGGRSYDARREFIQALARRIDLRRLDPRLQVYNPRLVQQAIYLFMSVANRRATAADCMHLGPAACACCPRTLALRCPVRRNA